MTRVVLDKGINLIDSASSHGIRAVAINVW